MRSSDWSSDVCSSDLMRATIPKPLPCSCEGQNPVPTPPAANPPELDSCLRRNATFLAAAQQTHRRVAFEEVEAAPGRQIGRASCRERVCQYWSISVAAVSLKQTTHNKQRKHGR